MPTRDTSVRLGVTGSQEFTRKLKAAGIEGQTGLERIEKASKPASAGLKAVNAASGEASKGISGLSSKAGVLSKIMTPLGAAGIAAGAAFGAFAVGLNRAGDAIPKLDEIGKTADSIDIGVEALQRYRFALDSVAGIGAGQTDAALKSFTTRIGQAARGSGEARIVLEQYGVELRNAQGEIRSTEALLGDVTRVIGTLNSTQERAALAAALFGEEVGTKLALALRDGGQAIEEAGKKAAVFEEQLVRQSEQLQDRITTASQRTEVALDNIALRLGPLNARFKEIQAEAATTGEDVARVIGDLFASPDELSEFGLVQRYEDSYGEFINAVRQLREDQRDFDENGPGFLNTERSLQFQREQVERLRAEYQQFRDELEERRNPTSPASGSSDGSLPSVPGGGGAAAREAADAAIKAQQRAFDIETKRARVLEDINVSREAELLVASKGVAASIAFEKSERERLFGLRAIVDARLAAQRAGENVDAAGELVAGNVTDATFVRRANERLAEARKVETQRLADQKKADALLARETQAAQVELKRLRDRETENQRRAAEEQAAIDRQVIADKRAAFNALTEIQRQQSQEQEFSVPLISAAGRVGDASSLEELNALRESVQLREQEIRIRQAGENAAAGAGRFENPELLRSIAEERERLTIQRARSNDLIRERAELLRNEEAARERVAANAQRASEAARRQQEQEIENIRTATIGLAQQAQGWDSVGQAILGVTQYLDQLGAFESLFNGLFGATDGGGGNFVSNLFGSAGAGLGDIFGAGGLARSLPNIPLNFEGGGRTPNVPRVGGLDGRGGFLAMVHGNERIIDETRPGNQSGGVVLNMTMNFGRGASREDVRAFRQTGEQVGRRVAQAVALSDRRR